MLYRAALPSNRSTSPITSELPICPVCLGQLECSTMQGVTEESMKLGILSGELERHA